jgi:hypothetical protein
MSPLQRRIELGEGQRERERSTVHYLGHHWSFAKKRGEPQFEARLSHEWCHQPVKQIRTAALGIPLVGHMNERDGWDALQFACEQRRREHTIGSQDVDSFKVLERVLRQHRRARKSEELTNLLFKHYASWRHRLRKKPKRNENGAPLCYALRQRRRAHRPHLARSAEGISACGSKSNRPPKKWRSTPPFVGAKGVYS